LHPSEHGHRVLAGCLVNGLAAWGFPVGPPPGTEPVNPAPTRAAQARWMATKGTGWLLRRSRDLLPVLGAMAAAEWWHELRGAAVRIDAHLAEEIAEALAGLGEPVAAACGGRTGGRKGGG
jgi:hypothetical protein